MGSHAGEMGDARKPTEAHRVRAPLGADDVLWLTLSASAHRDAKMAAGKLHAEYLDPPDVAQMALLMLWQRTGATGGAALEPRAACAWLGGTVWLLTLAKFRLERSRKRAMPQGRAGPILDQAGAEGAEPRHIDFAQLGREIAREAMPEALSATIRLLAYVQDLGELERLTGAPRPALTGRAKLGGWVRHRPDRRRRLAQVRDPIALLREADLTLAEIVAVSGQPRETVRKRLQRALGGT